MSRRRRIDTTIVIGLLIFLMGMLVGVCAVEFFKADCPAEDSCVVDYHDGEWHITEVNP